ncbi:hypothetical protein [Prescottella equi]|uniref:hypothetical protein n=1 Tax=Rhodococcus hoagii TaxID=43767 RepID=UPI001EEA3E28|nr:hypothetical protein [Prescottella equi]
MTNKDSYYSKSALRRFAARYVRPALTVSAVALSVLGLSQVGGTSAAWQDTGNTATSGGLGVASNVLPAIASPTGATTTWRWALSDIKQCHLTWTHTNSAFKYHVIVRGTSNNWYVDPAANNIAVGQQVSTDVWRDNTPNAAGSGQTYNVEIHTVNRFTDEEGADWRGYSVTRQGASAWHVSCGSPVSNVGGISGASQEGEFNARMAAPSDSPSTATTSTTSVPTTTTPSTTTTAPSSTTTTTPPQNTTTATTTAPPTTTTTPSTTAPSTTTTTTAADTTLGAAAKSTSSDYSATLVRSSEFSQTAIVISDANGEELKRISATASTQYKWDSSTDTLWIVEGGQLYKASGSTWSKTSVDPSSSDVPADIAALVE